jgi:hypothetical protein
MPLFVLGAWMIADSINSSAENAMDVANESPRRSSGLREWFVISCVVAGLAGLLLIALVGAALHWDWVSGRVGDVLAPVGAALAAAIASAGAARTLLAQSTIAQRDRLEDAERLLWERFQKGAEQLSDERYAIRAAGVYSLAGLADDWIRHHERSKALDADGSRSRPESAECETIVDILCAYLRGNRHLNMNLNESQRKEEAIVNEAIIAQIASHTRLTGNANGDPPPQRLGLWARRGIVMDLRGADLSKVLFRHVDLKGAILYRANLYDADLRGADLAGAQMYKADLRKTWFADALLTEADLAEATYDPRQPQWPTNYDPPPSIQLSAIEGPYNGWPPSQ